MARIKENINDGTKKSMSAKAAKFKELVEGNNAIDLKNITKSTAWDVQENDVIRMLGIGSRDPELRDNMRHYLDIFRSAFTIDEIKGDDKMLIDKYTKQGFEVGTFSLTEVSKITVAIKKRPILRVTDLTYENIRHISAAKLIEVLERNFGGGWDSLSQSIQDIIESGFDISTTTLPKDRLHKKGGMYEKKVADGYEVLEVAKGTWVEAIFAKVKPEAIKPRMKFDDPTNDNDDDEERDLELPADSYNKPDEYDDVPDEPNDEDITEENYRTTFELSDDPDDEDAESLSDYIADE
jgi:hypothetical protein